MSDSSAVRRLAARLLQVERGLKNVSTVPQLGRSSIDDEALTLRDGDGNVMGRVGKQSDGTYGATTLDGPTPVAPSVPVASGGPGSLTVEWDGQFADDASAPLDFHVVEIYVATEPFTTIGDARLFGHFSNEAGGEITVARPKGEQHVALVTKARSGKRSELSPLATAEVESVVDQETIDDLNDALENMPSITWLNRAPEPADGEGKPVGAVWRELNDAGEIIGEFEWDGAVWVARPISGDAVTHLELGKLTAALSQLDEVVANRIFADIFAANQITAANIDTETLGADAGFIGVLNSAEIVGAIIKTAASGMRVELDSANGIRVYNDQGVQVLSADANGDLILAGDMSLVGAISAGTSERVAKFSSQGVELITNNPREVRQFNTRGAAERIAVQGNRIYVSAAAAKTIEVYNLEGILQTTIPTPENIYDIAVDSSNLIAAANGRIYVYTRTGGAVRNFPTATGGGQYPRIAIANGLIYSSGFESNNISVYSKTGTLSRTITTSAEYGIRGLAADNNNVFAVATTPQDTIMVYTTTGTFVRNIDLDHEVALWLESYDGHIYSTTSMFDATTPVPEFYQQVVKRTPTGERVYDFIVSGDLISFSLDADRLYIVTGREERSVRVYDDSPGNHTTVSISARTGRLTGREASLGGVTTAENLIAKSIRPAPDAQADNEQHTSRLRLGPTVFSHTPNMFKSEAERDFFIADPERGQEAIIYGRTVFDYRKWYYDGWNWRPIEAAHSIYHPGDPNDIILPGAYHVGVGQAHHPNFPSSKYGMLVVASHIDYEGTGLDTILQTYSTVEVDPPHRGAVFTRIKDPNIPGNGWAPWQLIISGDTGWVDLSSYLLSGYTGSFTARINPDGATAIVQADLIGSVPLGNTTITDAIPEKYRPTQQNVFSNAYLSGGNTGSSFIRPSGTLGLANRTDGARTSAIFTIQVPLG